ncbi:hypothetical protein JANAI62_10600 [Jannaschia pagri]|uniref:DUF423 domain-containing protein n=1 Tax=Jannaschia pagri TaxID=2829797 RepID=A0ABQ4NK19_9RHOB|nr:MULTISPECIES: hypothetical protein [unclassified Jannaschia]GIT90605.1 hypothetical protein JANAI61_10630 [Jannaschia sp. AI_61]GIT94437.1 hypothetical protein JANAI62_10600 [Jannaschia sp. AI_62]
MFIAASLLSGLWALVHIFAGGAQVAAPLRAAPMDTVVRETALLVWHMTSFVLLFLTGLFAWAAVSGEVILAWAGLVLSGGLTAVGIGLQIGRRLPFAVLPQGWLFVPVTALAVVGVMR